MGVRPDGDAEGTRKSKIGDLQIAGAGDEEVLRLEVPVQDTRSVAKSDATQELQQEPLDMRFWNAMLLHVQQLLEVVLHKLKHERELLVSVNDVA
jgi:hypothetical protein